MTTNTVFLLETGGIQHIQQPPLRYCGHCQTKTVLAYNNIDTHSYHTLRCNKIANHTGFMLPHNFKKIQHTYGISTSLARAHKQKDKIHLIKKTLVDTRQPLVLEIAHGYTVKNKKISKPSWGRMLALHHWVSIRGFDDAKQIFYMYDSAFPSEDGALVNVEIAYKDLLYYRRWGVFGIYNYLYISFNIT